MNLVSKNEAGSASRLGPNSRTAGYGQIVLVLQGGGALGAYQSGVYHALHEAGIEPDWVIGTSIGAINASLIVGNEPNNRLAALQEFWGRMTQRAAWDALMFWPQLASGLSYWQAVTSGISGFYKPNPMAFCGPHVQLGSEKAGFYSTSELESTLNELVDFKLIRRNTPRLTVGAAQVRTSQMHYFDSQETEITAKHIMASGALPPAFPAVQIDGELYWDGGILSNTPAEAIFDDNPRKNSLVFTVHVWNPVGPEPETIWEVLHRQKNIQYSSRVATHITRQAQIHRLRHIIKELAKYIPEELRTREEVRHLTSYGCLTRMHFVRLLWSGHENEDHTKDVDFSASGIKKRWQAGYEQTMRAIEQAPWQHDVDPIEGVFLHEPKDTISIEEMMSRDALPR
ncbi:MAG: patatin-like phospholipase family protein [Proteobacteria bacterium]|nr:patatin-like phospholipase family protein [Pseudomonadota bacterium]